MRRPAKNRATSEAPMKIGRYGSSTVKLPIHAPLKPRVTRTSGPRQQVEARMAARPPVSSAVRPFGDADMDAAPFDSPAMGVAYDRTQVRSQHVRAIHDRYLGAERGRQRRNDPLLPATWPDAGTR